MALFETRGPHEAGHASGSLLLATGRRLFDCVPGPDPE